MLESKNNKPVEKAKRFNLGKPRWSLVEFNSLEPLVRALEHGADKYGVDNWKLGLDDRETIDSMYRHLHGISSGEMYDKESGVMHAGHLMANIMMFVYKKYGEGYTPILKK